MSSEREQKLRAEALRKQIGQRARRAAPTSEPQTPRALTDQAAAKEKEEAEAAAHGAVSSPPSSGDIGAHTARSTPEDDSDTCPKDRQDK